MRPLAVYSFLFTTVLSFAAASQPQDCGCGDISQYPLVYPVFTSKVGQYNCSCQPKRAGQLKFADGKLFVCTGTEWKAVQYEQSVSYGSESNPGSSCKDIKSKTPTLGDGIYWVTLRGSKDPFPVYCDMVAGGWTMVFKAVSGTGTDVYNTYTSNQTYSEKVMAALDVTKRHHSHYKNRIVLKWKNFGASEARVALYKGKNMMKELKFNAQGSDNLTWFSFSRLIQSPWSDIKTEPRNYFSITGNRAHHRYFFINSIYASCSADAGWLMITGSPCNWEKHFKRNVVIYSKLSGNTKWIDYSNVGVADTLVVYLR